MRVLKLGLYTVVYFIDSFFFFLPGSTQYVQKVSTPSLIQLIQTYLILRKFLNTIFFLQIKNYIIALLQERTTQLLFFWGHFSFILDFKKAFLNLMNIFTFFYLFSINSRTVQNLCIFYTILVPGVFNQ